MKERKSVGYKTHKKMDTHTLALDNKISDIYVIESAYSWLQVQNK